MQQIGLQEIEYAINLISFFGNTFIVDYLVVLRINRFFIIIVAQSHLVFRDLTFYLGHFYHSIQRALLHFFLASSIFVRQWHGSLYNHSWFFTTLPQNYNTFLWSKNKEDKKMFECFITHKKIEYMILHIHTKTRTTSCGMKTKYKVVSNLCPSTKSRLISYNQLLETSILCIHAKYLPLKTYMCVHLVPSSFSHPKLHT